MNQLFSLGHIVVICGPVNTAQLSEAIKRCELASVLCTTSMNEFSKSINDLQEDFKLYVKHVPLPVMDYELIPVRRHYGPVINNRKGKRRKW